MERTSRRLAPLFAFCVAAATSVARPPESPDEMAAEMERWLVEGAGARFPGGMADPARDADAIADALIAYLDTGAAPGAIPLENTFVAGE